MTIRLCIASAILIGLATTAIAKDFTVNDEEQKNILVICEIAARSPNIPIETTAGVAQFCVAWKTKMAAADKPPEKQPSP